MRARASTNKVPTIILDRASVIAIKVIARSPWLRDELWLPIKAPEVRIVDNEAIQPQLADALPSESESRSRIPS